MIPVIKRKLWITLVILLSVVIGLVLGLIFSATFSPNAMGDERWSFQESTYHQRHIRLLEEQNRYLDRIARLLENIERKQR